MCCWPFAQIELEEPPSPPKPEEEKREYVLVSDELRLHPGVSRLFFSRVPLPFTLLCPPYISTYTQLQSSILTINYCQQARTSCHSFVPRSLRAFLTMSYYYKYVPHYSGQVNTPPPKPEEPKAPNPWLASAAPPPYVACQVASPFRIIA